MMKSMKNDFSRRRIEIQNLISAILEAIDPYKKTKEALKNIEPPRGRIFLVAFGKSSVKMAKAVTDTFNVEAGIISTNEDVKFEHERIEFVKAGHPLPNEKSFEAAEKAIELLKRTREGDTVFVMISGGGSALFESPLIPLEELRKITERLMKSGADINELNTVRKSLSKVKGGRLLNYTRARVFSFVMSDVIGDDLSVIASGPTYPQKINMEAAMQILKKYGISVKLNERLTTSNANPPKVKHFLVASNRDACQAALKVVRTKGYNAFYLGSSIRGEAREVAKTLSGIYVESHDHRNDFKPPTAIVSGGETTVTVKGKGKSGRNPDLCLAMAPFISHQNITFFSLATDGVDGNSPAAGAVIDGYTIERAKSLGMNYKEFLENNDSYNFFKALSDLIILGPTGTNVMDVHVAIIG